MDYISIYDIYGVKKGADAVVDHPDFPNPRSDQGDLRGLAEGMVKSGGRDNPIVVWKRGGERILLDGKRTVTAFLRYQFLRDALDERKVPVMYWQPKANDGVSPEQEAMAYQIRANSELSKSGHKLLTFKEEMAAARRLKETGLSNEAVGAILSYSREIVRRLLVAEQKLDESLKDAVGERVTPEKPLTREIAQDIAAAGVPKAEQKTKLQIAQEAAMRAVRSGKKTQHAMKMAVGKAVKESLKPKAIRTISGLRHGPTTIRPNGSL